MRRPKSVRPVLTGLLFLTATAASAESLAALDGITPGEWLLRERAGSETRAICVRDTLALLQIQHAGASCTRFVVANGPKTTTVSYSCPGLGSGRTTITIETESLFRLQTQGLAKGAPFDLDFEARRRGACTGS